MWYAFVGMLVTGALVAPGGLLAQGDPAPRADDADEYRFERNGDRLMRIVLNRRARLGIKVNLQARESDSIGAYVDAVTPGGPAATAGLQSGDIITKLDGKSVLSGATPGRPAGRQSLPGLHLIELAARLQPNDTVPVEFRRGKNKRTVSLVTEDDPGMLVEGPGGRPFVQVFPGGGPDGNHPVVERFEMPMRRAFMADSPLGDLELAPLNPDLGQYFGATEGVLVVSSADSTLGLKGGDVVLSVDGRKPEGPNHLMRILRSYEPGETFKLDILRNRKRETVAGRLGEREER